MDGLTWGSFLGGNLPPVTLGNIIGGAVFVSFAYIAAYGAKRGVAGPGSEPRVGETRNSSR
jgi:formate/nitrite transporter FocA (FNT family)